MKLTINSDKIYLTRFLPFIALCNEHPGYKKRDLYFTNDHKWIHFRGSIEYIGVSYFKLPGIRKIKKFDFEKKAWGARRIDGDHCIKRLPDTCTYTVIQKEYTD